MVKTAENQSSSYEPITKRLGQEALAKNLFKDVPELLASINRENALEGDYVYGEVPKNLHGDQHGGNRIKYGKSGGPIVDIEEQAQNKEEQKKHTIKSKNPSEPTSPKLGT